MMKQAKKGAAMSAISRPGQLICNFAVRSTCIAYGTVLFGTAGLFTTGFLAFAATGKIWPHQQDPQAGAGLFTPSLMTAAYMTAAGTASAMIAGAIVGNRLANEILNG
jgi:hypothetical protein